MDAAIDRATVEKVMDECDALGEEAFVEKLGLSLRGVRYRVVRGNKRYPSKAIANAAYEIMNRDGRGYGGTAARKVLVHLGYQIVEGVDTDDAEDERSPAEVRAAAAVPTNLILYGPPGTGKTFATAQHAVRLCLDLPSSAPILLPDQRSELMAVYKTLVDARRIQFVTFHQSYSYEEFVEGLRPDTSDEAGGGAGFRLVPTRGVFRDISALAEQARKSPKSAHRFDVKGRRVFKMSLGRAGFEDYIFEAAIEGGYIALGYGGGEDWSDPRYDGAGGHHEIFKRWNEIEPNTPASSGNISQLWSFRSQMQRGDLVVVPFGNTQFRAIGEVVSDYRHDPSEENEYHHRREVRWLLIPDEPLPADTIYDKPFTQRSCYLLNENHLNVSELERLLSGGEQLSGRSDAYVLVVDEINRANISKVFGELITLIEADKRIDGLNEIKVRLPYSRDLFGVPPNLHLIGTMNTADRSIALLDTALRRRFEFVELMPDPKQLDSLVDGVPLRAALQTINERIEYLFDRDHQIGHGFFMACRTRADIDRVMRSKVVPLLQEYFFEDWKNIARVLGDADADAGQGKFIVWEALRPPVGRMLETEGGEHRRRWSVFKPTEGEAFPAEAYDQFMS